jgi:hypothetical protein
MREDWSWRRREKRREEACWKDIATSTTEAILVWWRRRREETFWNEERRVSLRRRVVEMEGMATREEGEGIVAIWEVEMVGRLERREVREALSAGREREWRKEER